MLALTATATQETVQVVSQNLSLKDVVVSLPPSWPNIISFSLYTKRTLIHACTRLQSVTTRSHGWHHQHNNPWIYIYISLQ